MRFTFLQIVLTLFLSSITFPQTVLMNCPKFPTVISKISVNSKHHFTIFRIKTSSK